MKIDKSIVSTPAHSPTIPDPPPGLVNTESTRTITFIPSIIPIEQWYKGGIKLFSPKTHFGIKVGIKVWANWYKGWYKQLLTLLTTLLTFFNTYNNTIALFNFLSVFFYVRGKVNV